MKKQSSKQPDCNKESNEPGYNENKAPCIVIGQIYGQNVSGTIFKYEVLEHKGEFHGKQYYIVRNIETEYRFINYTACYILVLRVVAKTEQYVFRKSIGCLCIGI